MNGFMIMSDYSCEQGAFNRPVVVLDMYDDTETVINTITNKGREIVTECDKDHPLVVCLGLTKWASYKTIQRLYTVLSLFRDSIKDIYDVNVIVDFSAETAEILSRFNLLGDFETLAGSSLDVKEYPTE